MRFRRVELGAPWERLESLADFYVGRLGLDVAAGEVTGATIRETQLVFSGGPGEPFYHFALLVPGNRFDAALEWIVERAELLPDPASGEVVFDFDNWDALACYFHDPAGNIVELIAHRGIDESEREGPFAAPELLGLSELGLVGNKRELAAALGDLGLEQWDGDIEDEERLAFLGEKARTFILSPEGRGWLPTSRPAEAHSCGVELDASFEGAAQIGDSRILGISRREPLPGGNGRAARDRRRLW
jgi:catechol 2,3-dioxygenase-like lactoylglutathione lyase family enzyme